MAVTATGPPCWPSCPPRSTPTPGTLERLAHEYGLQDELDGGWAARPLELVHEHGRTLLVLEDPGGEPLDRLLGSPMEVGTFLRLAIGIAMALAKVHQRGLIHKDLKPGHILVDRASGEVRLTGFGIASRLPREHPAPEPPEVIAGTLAYMAPEQTGRMNRSVDARSDLYALGVTLYQMLTGGLPFTAPDLMELVHCHIARRPVPPAERAPRLAFGNLGHRHETARQDPGGPVPDRRWRGGGLEALPHRLGNERRQRRAFSARRPRCPRRAAHS